jgi:hypothetical protein
MASLGNGGLHTRLGFHVLNTEERGRTDTRMGWAGRPMPSFGPICPTLHLLHFISWAPSIVGFERRFLHDQVEGPLCMNFLSFHLGS